jgi:hypothetical protein
VRQASSGHFGRYFAGYFETIPALKAMVTAIGNDYFELCSNVSTRTALEPCAAGLSFAPFWMRSHFLGMRTDTEADAALSSGLARVPGSPGAGH